MQIKFSVKYTYYPAADIEKRFKAEVSAFLPKAKDKNSIPPCYRGKIGNYKVEYDSGINKENLRKVTVDFYANSFESLNEKIENAIEDYKRQVVKNIEIIQKIKENREIVKDFPDPIEDRGIIADLPDFPEI